MSKGDDNDKCFTLWVGNLHPKVTEELLWELFLQGGPLDSVSLPQQQSEGASPGQRVHRGFAFVRFTHWQSVAYCEKIFASTTLFGQRLSVRAAHGRGQARRGSLGGDAHAHFSGSFTGADVEPHKRYSLPGFHHMSPHQRFIPPFMQTGLQSPTRFSTPVMPPHGVVSSPVAPLTSGFVYADNLNMNRSPMLSTTTDGRNGWRDERPSESRGAYRDGYPERRTSRDFRNYGDDVRGQSRRKFTEDARVLLDRRDSRDRDMHYDRQYLYDSGRARDRDYSLHDHSSRRSEASMYDDRSYREKHGGDHGRSRESDVGSRRYKDSPYGGRYSHNY